MNPFDEPAQSVDLNDNDSRYTQSYPRFSPPPVPSAPPGARPQSIPSNAFSWENAWNDAKESIFSLNTPFTIVVNSPEIANSTSMMGKYIEYSVRTMPLGFTVRRRFNDFAWLRETLIAQYPGLFMPTLPVTSRIRGATQRITGEQMDINGEFIRHRLEHLNLFMSQLSQNPFIRTCPSFVAFVSVFKELEWKAIVSSPTGLESNVDYKDMRNDGQEKWFETLDGFFINAADAHHTANEYRHQLEIALKTLEGLDKEAKNSGRKAVQFVLAANQMQETLMAWQKAEIDFLDPNMNQLVNPHGARVRTLMTNLALGQLQWTTSISLMPQIIGRVLLKNIQYQELQVDHFLQHLLLRETTVKELEKAEKERVRAVEEKNRADAAAAAGAKRNMFSKPIEQLEELCEKKTQHVATLQRTVDRMTKALIFCEMDRFNRERVKHIYSLVGSLAVTNVEITGATQSRWNDVITNIGTQPDEFKDCLDSLRSHQDVNEIFAEHANNNSATS